MNLDPTTNTSLNTRYKFKLRNYTRDRCIMDTDGVLQNKFMHTKIKHAIADYRHSSKELNILKLRRITTIGDAIQSNNDSKNILQRILKPELKVRNQRQHIRWNAHSRQNQPPNNTRR